MRAFASSSLVIIFLGSSAVVPSSGTSEEGIAFSEELGTEGTGVDSLTGDLRMMSGVASLIGCWSTSSEGSGILVGWISLSSTGGVGCFFVGGVGDFVID